MGDLHLIVELAARANHGGPEPSPVHRCVCTNLHIILDPDLAHLRNLVVHPLALEITVAIRTDHRAGLHLNTISQLAAGFNHHVGMQHAIRADHHV